MLAVDLDTGNLAKMLFTRKHPSEKHKYALLSRTSLDEEGVVDPETPTQSPSTRHTSTLRRFLFAVLKLIILLLAFQGTISIVHVLSLRLFPPRRPSCNCGDTLSEALQNKCVYDELAASYLPPACRDDALSQQFSRAGPNLDGSWTYYADHNGTIPLTAYEVSQLPLTGSHFFATHEWHLLHCSYYWRKLMRSVELGTVMEKRYEGDMHMGHCEMMFLKRDPLEKIVTEAGVSLHADVLVIDRSHKHEHDEGMGQGNHRGHVHKEGMKMDVETGEKESGY